MKSAERGVALPNWPLSEGSGVGISLFNEISSPLRMEICLSTSFSTKLTVNSPRT